MEAARLLLDGVFAHITDVEKPMQIPRMEYDVTYPHRKDTDRAVRASRFESLVRTFLLASVLIREDPDLILRGIPVAAYYKKQILSATGPNGYAGTYSSFQTGKNDPVVQQTVECGLLVIGLESCRTAFFDTFSEKEKQQVLDFLEEYAYANLPGQNWLLFSLMILAFLHQNGMPVDRDLIHRYACRVNALYAGDGWYRDGTSFDYYSCWAFQIFAPLWCVWYGDQYEPEAAACIRKASDRLMSDFPAFFGADGRMIFWGRSASYRFAHLSALYGNLRLHDAAGDPAGNGSLSPGRMRTLASAVLSVFLKQPELLHDGVLSPGLYRMFSPVLQPYSCAASVYWSCLAFLFLTLPEDHPFWTAAEEDIFPSSPAAPVQSTCLPGPGLALSFHPANGTSILRSGKVLLSPAPGKDAALYAKISYHSSWPLEMDSGASIAKWNAASQEYVLRAGDNTPEVCNVCFFLGEEEGILYRRSFFSFAPGREWHWMDSLLFADFPVPLGLFHVCRPDPVPRPLVLTLGSYGFPAEDTVISSFSSPEGTPSGSAVCLRHTASDGKVLQMAMTVYGGWEEEKVLTREGLNPVWKKTMMITASFSMQNRRGSEAPLLITQLLSKETPDPFTEEELFPLSGIKSTGIRTRFLFKNGMTQTIDFSQKEGCLTL